jgi:hypothetical protein
MRVWYPLSCRSQASKSASSRMVTTVFRVGHTTLASFQNSSSVGRTSGSDAMPRRIWASLLWRSLLQSVPAPRSDFDVLPVRASFVRFRPPRRDDASFVVVFIRVNHRNFQAVHQANRIDSALAVVETVINPLNRRPVEDTCSIFKGNPMSDEIATVLLSVPTVSHFMYLHNVNIRTQQPTHVFPVPPVPNKIL